MVNLIYFRSTEMGKTALPITPYTPARTTRPTSKPRVQVPIHLNQQVPWPNSVTLLTALAHDTGTGEQTTHQVMNTLKFSDFILT